MKLKPCPFCEGEARLESDREPFGINAYHAVALCLNEDGCHANIHAVEESRDAAKIAAFARWNRRAPREKP